MLIVAWVVTAILTITAALSYCELACTMPKAGGGAGRTERTGPAPTRSGRTCREFGGTLDLGCSL